MATLIRAYGVEAEITPENVITGFTCCELTRLIGGKARLALLGAESAMIINPSASQMGAGTNRRAMETALFRRFKALDAELNDICGDVLIVSCEELNLDEALRKCFGRSCQYIRRALGLVKRGVSMFMKNRVVALFVLVATTIGCHSSRIDSSNARPTPSVVLTPNVRSLPMPPSPDYLESSKPAKQGYSRGSA